MHRETSATGRTGHRADSPQIFVASRATQALVASFLGGAALDRGPLGVCGWTAVATLVVGLALSVVVLAPWQMRFALDVGETYIDLREASATGGLTWLLAAALAYEEQCRRNDPTVKILGRPFGLISIATMMEMLLWILAVAVR